MKIRTEVELKDIIDNLTEELNNICYCDFQRRKQELSRLKEVICRRWDESIDPHCIE